VTALLSGMPQVTVAKVNGFCFTGALELALACDLVVVAEEAKLGDTHAKFALRPTWGLTQRLPRAVGLQAARDLSLTARTFTGAEARAMGLAARCAPAAELDAEVAGLLGAILANSDASLRAYKDLYARTQELPLAEGLRYEYNTDYPIDTAETAERLSGFR
jgi:enoyl-CoA hydratase/carnithine racemase